MTLRFACVSMVAWLAGTAPAAAGGVLVTPPVFADTAGLVACMVQNLTGEYVSGSGRLRDADADIIAESSDSPIPPGVGFVASEANATGVFYCSGRSPPARPFCSACACSASSSRASSSPGASCRAC